MPRNNVAGRAVDLNAGLAITVLACLNCGRRKAADSEPRPITSRHWSVALKINLRALTCDELGCAQHTSQAYRPHRTSATHCEKPSHIRSWPDLEPPARFAVQVFHADDQAKSLFHKVGSSAGSIHCAYFPDLLTLRAQYVQHIVKSGGCFTSQRAARSAPVQTCPDYSHDG